MSIFRRRLMMGQGERELPYDAEVEFLQNVGSSYILTDYIPNGSGIKFQGKFHLDGYSAAYAGWFGAYRGESYSAYRVFRGNTDNTKLYFTCGTQASKSGVLSGAALDTTYEFELTSTTLKVNSLSRTYSPINGSRNTDKLKIFTFNGKGFTYGKLYYLKVFNGNSLVFDFIPVRVREVGCLYDKVGERLYFNEGSGDFLIGGDI